MIWKNARTVYSHNQLYGRWCVSPRGEFPTTNRSLRLGLHTETHSARLYSASDISVWATQNIHQHPLLSKLGPDILSDGLNAETILKRLMSKQFRRRRLCSLYLDQHFLAGIGNYLRSEILFFSGLHPDLNPINLTDKERQKISEISLIIPQRSYATQGYTVDESRWRTAIKNAANFEQSRFMVFDREGLNCRVCDTPVLRLNRNSRRLYFCPTCQPNITS